ncbi:hypothetical protein [Cryptosporangium aurantiacum]|uniref:Transaldolase n=1 Tax=Cryptosporangium aurantiacum TaxID=134849 RepID=A0A1M7L0N0_9ACTN|nr:hypothetical protein [Cryptosporangium aurantiacum]SHM71395.1 hypothetical protein SAMN05443668_1011317 [Cryptosporangium aurantiacum]
MTTPDPTGAATAEASAPAELWRGLFDDAALFPPGDAPMAAAVPAHQALRARLGDLVGPFVVPAARLDELTAHLGDAEAPFGVSVIAAPGDLPAALARVRAHPGLALAAIEIPIADDVRQAITVLDAEAPDAVPVTVELPRSGARDAVLNVLAETRYRAKLRTGGLVAEAFPSPAELAGTLRACVARGVAFKCTAGLHHAVRHTDPATGFTHHGFLNLLLATAALLDGGVVAEAWLAETNPDTVTAAVRSWSPQRAARVRTLFTSFGTCSVLEPVHDLVALGLLPAPHRSTS